VALKFSCTNTVVKEEEMLAARIYGYNTLLVLEDIGVPEILPDQVLVKVAGAGMCRSDVQLVDGYFSEALNPKFPITPGHEIAGIVSAVGDQVPNSAELAIGDQVVVAAGWGDGTCRESFSRFSDFESRRI
jgi:alcohol dehydrogenase, propanol-preferring